MSDQPRILIVDDDAEMCQILGMQLARKGYDVECVLDAGSALIRLSNDPFDVVLTDLMMPGMSGTDLLRMIRKTGKETPVVVLTGRESLDSAVTAAGLHVSAYLKKGTTSGQDLVDAIERALGNLPSD